MKDRFVSLEPVQPPLDRVYYYHSDHLGSSTYVTDDIGRPVAYYDYLPFGEVAVEHNQTTNFNNGYKFNGKELDQATGMYYYGARYYDPRLSVFISVDPLAEVQPNKTPYHFVSNNPVNFVDPDGRFPYPIVIRSFHPAASFGGGKRGLPPTWNGLGYSGDNRGFSLNSTASSRIHHRVVADPQKGTVSYSGRGRGGTYSDPSHHPTQGVATDVPNGYIGRVRSGNNSVSFETGYEGKNPLASGPISYIDVDAIISLSQNGDILNINAQVAGDNFPNTEAFITDPSGQKLFIGTDVRAAGQDDMPTILFEPATEHIMNVNMNVKTDPKTGNFISVQKGDDWISVQDYNKQYLNKNPNP
ncbi:RHS repeat-associated core domain-containing protein [Capnocytophaga sp. ARDL2]|uniref:RHS repeat-associated core domain-containing protein n=1 Tax=Capnocytophaga sp. ARDL2 TaxID=3238809 RepID=UPI00355728AC